MKKFFKQYFFLLDNTAKKKFPVLSLIFLSTSLLDVFGISLIMFFLALMVNFDSVLHKLPAFLQDFFHHYTKNEVIFFMGIGLVIAFVFKAYWGIYSQKKIVLFTSQFSVRLKMRLMMDYQNATYSFHLKQNSAYLINKASLVDGFSNSVLASSLNILSSSLVMLGITTSLLIFHPLITLFLMAMVFVIIALYEMFVKNKLISMGKILAIANGEINKSILQAFGGLKEIRVLGKEWFFLNKIKEVSTEYSAAISTYSSLQLIPRYTVESAASIFLVVLILGALSIGISPISMIPTLGVFSAACIRLLPTISQLIGQFSQLRSAAYATNLLYEEINELENASKTNLTIDNNEERLEFSQFSLQKVFFRYPGAKQNALNCVDLTVLRGQSIGLMGSSGAGKSTLVNIILGLLAPDEGRFIVDGSPIKNTRAWLNNFAYIPQAIFLLDDTVKRNIAMGTADENIDTQKLCAAIEMAQLREVVDGLPNGVDTLIGENGIRLSGGQRQRIALARALYHEREIIVMDEATSALDNETEHEVINSIRKLQSIKTLIVIAHRLTTLVYCDRVYKFEKGQIAAQGSFFEVVGNIETQNTTHI